MNRQLKTSRRSAFTLVELLVVVAILAILSTLAIAGAVAATVAARNGVIAVELENLDVAMRNFKIAAPSSIGYPPDGTDGAVAVEAYVNAIFPNRVASQDASTGIDIHTGNRISADLADLDPSEALYFWLGGFGQDPQHPLSGATRKSPLFDFDPLRLKDNDGDGWLEYQPKYCQGAPYMYFCNRTYSTASYAHHNGGMARPYQSDVALVEFAQDNQFQIIAAGQDGDFGGGGSFPSGAGYHPADHDNITNFSEGTLANHIR